MNATKQDFDHAGADRPAEQLGEGESSLQLDALTLVIPTYNRAAHLKRLLAYYRQAGLRTRFIILDSSDEEVVAENAALIASCGEGFRHVVYPSSLPVAAKLSKGLDLVETAYCAFCADDDLVFPKALSHALDFLAHHDDYVCCDGIYLNFFPLHGDINFQVEYGSRGIEAEHPAARIFRLFQRYESMFYAVFRTPDLRDVFSFVKDIPSLHYQELFQAAGALLKGKSHRLPEFYAARQHCDPAEPERDNWQTFYWFVDDNVEFLAHYREYRDQLWGFYERFGVAPHMERKAFENAMDMAHVTFFSANCPPKYFHSRLQEYWPHDEYKDIEDSEGICDELRREGRIVRSIWLYDLLEWLRKKAEHYAPRIAKRSLEREVSLLVKKDFGWGCKLPPDLWWMASVPKFQEAFVELCRYLGHADKQADIS